MACMNPLSQENILHLHTRTTNYMYSYDSNIAIRCMQATLAIAIYKAGIM